MHRCYIANFPKRSSTVRNPRKTLKKYKPEATETISYKVLCLHLTIRCLIYFGGLIKIILVFMPFLQLMKNLRKILKPFKTSKGAVTVSFDYTLPLPLMQENMSSFRVQENKRLKR